MKPRNKPASPSGKKKPTNPRFAKRFPPRKSAVAEILSKNVRCLREKLDLSQADLGKAIGADQAAIGLIELGRANPTLRTLENIAETLGTTVADLLKQGRRTANR